MYDASSSRTRTTGLPFLNWSKSAYIQHTEEECEGVEVCLRFPLLSGRVQSVSPHPCTASRITQNTTPAWPCAQASKILPSLSLSHTPTISVSVFSLCYGRFFSSGGILPLWVDWHLTLLKNIAPLTLPSTQNPDLIYSLHRKSQKKSLRKSHFAYKWVKL